MEENQNEMQLSVDKLMIRGCLNAEIYRGMKDEEVNAFIIRDVNSTARKFVSEEWTGEVTVKCVYTVIDCRLNKTDEVHVDLVYNHDKGSYIVKKTKKKL